VSASTVHLVVRSGPPPDTTPGDAIAAVLAAAALLLAWSFARRRAADPNRPGHWRFIRILAAAATYVIAFHIGEIVLALLGADIGASGSMMDADGAAFSLLLVLLLFWAADRLVDRLRPTRDPFWRVAAPFGFVLIVAFSVYVPAWRWGFEAPPLLLPALRLVLSAAAAGLVWCAMLPPDKARVAQVFD
jgi:hypothetical protein